MEKVTQRSPANKGEVGTPVNKVNVETVERDLQRIDMQLQQRVARDAFHKRQVTRNLAAIHDKIYVLEKQMEIRKVVGQFGFDVNMKHGFSAHLEKQIETISSALCVLAPQISWKCVLISGMCTIRMIWKHNDLETVVLAITQFLATLALPSEVVSYLYEFCMDAYVKGKELLSTRRVVGQMQDLSEIIPLAGSTLAVFLTTLILRVVPGGDKPTELINRFAKIGGVIRSIGDVSTIGRQFLETVIDCIRVKLFGCDSRQIDEWAQVNEWYDQVMEIVPGFEEKLRADPSMKLKVDTLFERGLNITKMLDSAKTPQVKRDHVNKVMMLLYSFRDKAAGVSAGQIALRVPPAIYHIFGDSGAGKSSILACLTADIQAALGVEDPKDVNLLTYYRQPGRDFWDGYRNAVNVVVCDDFGAIVDSETRPNEEFLEAIRMSNTAEYMLNMASLQDKGQTHFNAKAVIWTSNRPNFTCRSLTNFEAVMRRVKYKFRQYPKSLYATIDVQNNKQVEILDHAKIKLVKGKLTLETILDCIQFDQIDKVSGVVIKTGMSYREFSDMIVESTLSNKDYHTEFNDLINGYTATRIAEAKAKRAQGQGFFDRVEKNGQHKVLSKIDVSKAQFVDLGDLHISNEDDSFYHSTCVHTESPDFDSAYADAIYNAFLQGVTDDQKVRIFNAVFDKKFCGRFTFCNCTANPYEDRIETQINRSFIGKMLLEIKETIVSWANFNTFVALATAAGIGIMYYLSKKIWNYLVTPRRGAITQKLSEAYETDKTQARRSRRAEWFFSGPCTEHGIESGFCVTCDRACLGGHGNLNGYCYICDPTWYDRLQGKSVTHEGYDSDKTVTGRRRKAEFFWSGPCKHGVASGFCEVCDNACEGGHGNLKGYCYVCDPTWLIHFQGESISVGELYDNNKSRGRVTKKAEICDLARHGGPCRSPSTHEHDAWQFNNLEDLQKFVNDGGTIRKEVASEMREVEGQAILDKNAAEIVTKVYRNMYKLEYKSGEEWIHAMNLLVIKGRIAIANRHLLGMQHIREWRMINKHKPDGFPLTLWELNRVVIPDDNMHGDKDVMMFELPRLVDQHPDISGKFMTGCDFSRFSSLRSISAIGYVPQKEIVLRQYFSNSVRAIDEPIGIEGLNYVSHCRKYFEYEIQTTSGDCGAVLVAFDPNFANKIFGIHAAGDSGSKYCGIGTPLTQDVLKILESQLVCVEDAKMFPEMKVASELNVEPIQDEKGWLWNLRLPFVGNFMYHGKETRKVFANFKSTIVPSPVHGVIATPTMKPAHLVPFMKDGVKVDPMAKARVKASPAPKTMDKNLLNSAVHHYTQMVTGQVDEADRRVLTYAEAIQGIEGNEFYQGINRSTSPGYGWEKEGAGKTKWLGSEGEYNVSHPELLEAYEDMKETCLHNRPSVYWVDTMKDERRPIAKVDEGKTRLFSVGEMAFTVLFRQYFMGFIAHMMKNKIRYESCVGINPFDRDWTRLATGLNAVGKKVIAGDFANYDGTLNADLLWRMLDVIEAFYENSSAEDRMRRRSMWCEIVNSIHINSDDVYSWTHSQPSGCPMTTILNCGYHSISARYVFLVCAAKYMPELASLRYYNLFVRHFNFGDDDAWNISDAIIEWFNQVTITEAYATFGMEYTDEAKTGVIVPFRSRDDINFLKRTFRWDDVQCRFRAPLALETIREMAMWNKGTIDPFDLTAEVLCNAVVELAQHDRETFDRELPAFEKARRILSERVSVNFETYDDYQRIEAVKYC